MEILDKGASFSSEGSEEDFLSNVIHGCSRIEFKDPLHRNQYDSIKLFALSVAGNNLVQQLDCWNNVIKCQTRGIRMRVPNRIFRWSIQDCRKRNRVPIVPLRHLHLDFSRHCLELQKWKVDFREIKKIVITTLEKYLKNHSIFTIQLPINSAVDYVNYPQRMEQKLKQLKSIRYQPVINISWTIKNEKNELKYTGSAIDKSIFTTYVKCNYILASFNERKMKCWRNEQELRKKIDHYNFLTNRENICHAQTLAVYDSMMESTRMKEQRLKSPESEERVEKIRNIGYALENKIKGLNASLEMKMEEMQFFESEIAKAKEIQLLQSQNVDKTDSCQTIQSKKLKKGKISDKKPTKSKTKS